MEFAGLDTRIASLLVAIVTGTAGWLFAHKNAQNSSKRAEIARQAYLDSLPCQVSPMARIVAVDESSIGGISLQLEIHNYGLGRAFNLSYEAQSTFLRQFDCQRTVRMTQTLNLMRRDPGAARFKDPYPPFGFDQRLDMPPFLRDASLKYLEPCQRHTVTDLFFVPWQYLGHPSKRQLRSLDENLPSGISEGVLESIQKNIGSGMSEDKLKAITKQYRPRNPLMDEVETSAIQYMHDKNLPPGLLLYGTHDYGYGARGKAFLTGPGNGLQLTLRFSHCDGDETKYFALPYPLLIFNPETGREVRLIETDANGIQL